MNDTVKSNKWIGVILVMGLLLSYSGVVFFIDSFSNKLGLTQWVNTQRIMAKHKKDLLKRIQNNTHFQGIDLNSFSSEAQRLVKMGDKRNLSSWISFRTFTPNILGKYIKTNDFGIWSDLNLKEMIQKAQSNKKSGIKNIILLGGSTAFGYGATTSNKTISGYLNATLKKNGYEVFNLAQGGYTSFMDLFIFSSIGIYFEPDIIIVLDGLSDTYHLAYQPQQKQLALGLWSGTEKEGNSDFLFNFYYKNLEAICKLADIPNRKVILALQPISGFENDSRLDIDQIKNYWTIYPKVREVLKLAAKNNGALFIDLSILFKKEKFSRSNFFDKAHLSERGQKKVADALVKSIVSTSSQLPTTSFAPMSKRESMIKKIVGANYIGSYKTAEDF